MSDPYEVLHEKFREAYKNSEFTQKQLATKMGLKQPTICELLSGAKHMGPKSLGGILLVFPDLKPLVMAVLTFRGNGKDAA